MTTPTPTPDTDKPVVEAVEAVEALAKPVRSLAWRLLRIALALLLLLIVLFGAALYSLLGTAGGLRFAARTAPRIAQGAVKIGSVDGRILGGDFELHDVLYTGADGLTASIARVHLRWLPRELLQLRLHVANLDVDQLVVNLGTPPPPATPTPPHLPTRLPLDAVIDGLSLHDFTLNQPHAKPNEKPAAKPIVIADAHLRGRWIGTQVEIDELDTALAPFGALKLNARATMTPQQIQFAQLQLSGPGALKAQGAFGIGDGQSDLSLSFSDWHYPFTTADAATEATPPLAALHGDATFKGKLDAYHYTLNAAAVAHQQPLQVHAQGGGSLKMLSIEAFELQVGEAAKAGRATAKGSVAWSPVLRADLDLVLSKLDPAAFVADLNGELNGRAETHTQMQDGQPQIDFALTLTPSKLRGQQLQLSAHGSTDTRSAHLEDLLINLGKGSVVAKGDVAWLPQPRVDAQATLKQIDPAAFAAQWPGVLNGQLRASTRSVGGQPDIVFDLQLADSKLRNFPITLDAHGDALGKVVTLAQFALKSGATEMNASGQVTPPFAVSGKLASPDLAALYPGLGGRLDFDFALNGALDDPHFTSQGKGTALRFRQNRLGALSWHADLQPSTALQLDVLATDGDAGFAIPRVELKADGTETYHHLTFKANTERGDLDLALQGGFDRKKLEWGGEWQSVRLAPTGLPAWSLEKPVGLLVGAKRFSLEPACFAADRSGGRSCFNLQRAVSGPGLHLIVDLDAVALSGFQPLLPKGVQLDGRLDGHGDLSWVDNNVAAAHADLKLSEAHVLAPKAPPLELLPSTLTLDQKPDGALHAALELKSAQAQISAELGAAQAAEFKQRALSGHLHIAVPDIAFIQPYVYELSTVGGHIDGDLGFAGTIAAPRLSGKLALGDGHARLVTPGIELTAMSFSLSGNGEGPLNLQGAMTSGDGTLTLTGTVDPAKLPMRADLSVKGENFVAMSTPNAHVWITPDLHLLRDENGAKFDGTLTVPKADITPKDLGSSGVSVSRDQIIIVNGEPQVVESGTPLKIYSNVKLVLGDAVRFNGFGLVTRIEGAVTVNEEPLREPTAQGELRLFDGAYKAYGQDLTIEDGRLIFDGGAVTQPALDISASRHPADDIKVGVRVRGTLKKPLLTLQSEPAMSREQQLSWLVLGRALEQNSTQDRSAISSAALSLGLSGGDFLANRLGKKIGLDSISVGSAPAGGSDVAADATTITGSQASQGAGLSANSAAALTLGKFLTPKLFVSYGVSLFQPGQTFRILYTLSHGFKVQAESGVASGGDLLYTYERGKPKKPKAQITTQPASGEAKTTETQPTLTPAAPMVQQSRPQPKPTAPGTPPALPPSPPTETSNDPAPDGAVDATPAPAAARH